MSAGTVGAGRYRVIAPLAEGGMGEVSVVLREEGEFQRLYAMKRLKAAIAEDESAKEMFLDEARIAGHIRHPNVVSVLDIGSDESGPFLVMEYVEGVSLTRLLRAAIAHDENMPVAVCVRIMHQVALGLDAAHNAVTPLGEALNVIHRDISPHNILVGFNGVASLTDFGISRAVGRLSEQTTTGMLKGKVGYMSPEQLRFETVEHRSDLFAFGVVLFELLSGRRLYKSQPMEEAARRIMKEAPPDIEDYRGDIPDALAQLLFSLLAKDPSARPASARVVAERLDDVLTALRASGDDVDLERYVDLLVGADREERRALLSETWKTPKATPSPKSRSELDARPRTNRLAVAGLLAVVLLVVGATGLWIGTQTQEMDANADDSEASLERDTDPEEPPIVQTQERASITPVADPIETAPEDDRATAEEPRRPRPRVRRRPDRSRTAAPDDEIVRSW